MSIILSPASRSAGRCSTRGLGRGAEVVRISGKDVVRIYGTRTKEVRATKMKLGPGLMAPSVSATVMLSIAADSSIERLLGICALTFRFRRARLLARRLQPGVYARHGHEFMG